MAYQYTEGLESERLHTREAIASAFTEWSPFFIKSSEWGKGYTTEAAMAFKAFAFGHGRAPSLVSLIHADNFRSQKEAERNGMGREKKIKWSGKNIFLYRISNK
jgi:RimJ/RimL family protein N-acetyltransferase